MQTKNIISTFKKADGSNTDPGEETLNALLNTHFPSATKQINKKYTSVTSFSRDYIMANNEDWITEDLTRVALNLIQKKKSPGPDEIKPVIFEYLPLKFIRHLVFIYRSVILLKYTPKLWAQQSRLIRNIHQQLLFPGTILWQIIRIG